MKSLLIALCCISFVAAHAQTEPAFSVTEQARITSLLKGTGVSAKFDKNGNMRIDQTRNISKVKTLPGGGFKVPGGTAAWALIKSHWVLIADKSIQGLKEKLGQEKFKQLDALVKSKIKG